MASKYTEEVVCPKCGAKIKVVVTNGVWPMRNVEIGECPKCGTEVIRKNITGDIEVELIGE
jgi:Zn ribbon nucleic-acid-binding protein